MKNFKMFMLTAAVCFVAAPFFNSCSDSSEFSIPVDNSGIAGTFKLSSFTTPTAVDYNGDGTSSNDLLNESTCYNDNSIKLNSDHTYAKTDNYIDLSAGTVECGAFSETGIWKKDGNTITTTSSTSNGYEAYDTIYTYDDSGTLTDAEAAYDYPGADSFGNPLSQNGDVTFTYTRMTE